MKNSSLHSRQGFTLLEIVIAIGILGFMLSLAFTALTQISRAKRALDQERDAILLANDPKPHDAGAAIDYRSGESSPPRR